MRVFWSIWCLVFVFLLGALAGNLTAVCELEHVVPSNERLHTDPLHLKNTLDTDPKNPSVELIAHWNVLDA